MASGLSPEWVPLLRQHGFDAVHWSAIGNLGAADAEIIQWARVNSAIVLTHDLDFGVILAQTQANGPSVIQVRTQDVAPATLGRAVAAVLSSHHEALAAGALITVEPARSRVRILPIGQAD